LFTPSKVVDLQRYMAFDHAPGSTAWAVLGEAADVLLHAQATLHEKAEVRGAARQSGCAQGSALIPLRQPLLLWRLLLRASLPGALTRTDQILHAKGCALGAADTPVGPSPANTAQADRARGTAAEGL
jgi:hypothetical protein